MAIDRGKRGDGTLIQPRPAMDLAMAAGRRGSGISFFCNAASDLNRKGGTGT